MTNAIHPKSFPELTIDTLAFAIAADILTNPEDHNEFISPAIEVYSENGEETAHERMTQAVYDDIRDMISNGNDDDWLLCFYDNDGSSEGYKEASMKLDSILWPGGGIGPRDYGRHEAARLEIAEKAATVILKMREGISGRFGGFAATE